jgi:hypothetical protein
MSYLLNGLPNDSTGGGAASQLTDHGDRWTVALMIVKPDTVVG